MRLLGTYRAARRNFWRPLGGTWEGQPNYKDAKARWKHTALARDRVRWFLANSKGMTVHDVNDLLAIHWSEFAPRTRCISRMLRELSASKRPRFKSA